MSDVFITLREAAAFEGITYQGMTSRVARNPKQYKTKTQAREGGGKDQVLISVASLTAKARKAYRATQKVDGRDVIIDQRTAKATPWYVDADLNHYIEANKKKFYEAVELAARVQDFIDYEGPDRTAYAERYAPLLRCKGRATLHADPLRTENHDDLRPRPGIGAERTRRGYGKRARPDKGNT